MRLCRIQKFPFFRVSLYFCLSPWRKTLLQTQFPIPQGTQNSITVFTRTNTGTYSQLIETSFPLYNITVRPILISICNHNCVFKVASFFRYSDYGFIKIIHFPHGWYNAPPVLFLHYLIAKIYHVGVYIISGHI